jgi:hypothetical protein
MYNILPPVEVYVSMCQGSRNLINDDVPVSKSVNGGGLPVTAAVENVTALLMIVCDGAGDTISCRCAS